MGMAVIIVSAVIFKIRFLCVYCVFPLLYKLSLPLLSLAYVNYNLLKAVSELCGCRIDSVANRRL